MVVPLLVIAIGVPVIWGVVALFNGFVLGFDGYELSGTFQQASRFGYLLLYFPICDLTRRYGERLSWGLLMPVLGLCAATIAIWAYHAVTGWDPSSSQVLVFKGVIGMQVEGFRVSIANQVVFILGVAMVIARASVARPRWYDVVVFVAILFSAWLSHTRGIWLGMSAACISLFFGCVFLRAGQRVRQVLTGLLVVGAIALIAAGSVVIAGSNLGGLLGDESTSQRVIQAPELIDGFKGSPVIGRGLGAGLGGGFERSAESPWSFELTYLQIFFQLGLAGSLLLWGTIGYSIWVGANRFLKSGGAAWMPLAGASGLLGLLAAIATNPYLFSAFGMTIVAIAMVLLNPPSVTGSDPEDPVFALSRVDV